MDVLFHNLKNINAVDKHHRCYWTQEGNGLIASQHKLQFTFAKGFLCARHSGKFFLCIISFIPRRQQWYFWERRHHKASKGHCFWELLVTGHGGGDWGEVNVAASLWSVSPGSAPPQTPVHDLGEMAFPLWVEFPLHKMRNGQVPIPSLQGQKFWKPEVVPRPLQGQKGVKLMWDLIISLSVNMHFTEENTSVFDYSAPQSHLGSSVTFRMGSPELASHSESLTSRPQSFRSDTADFE